MSTKLKIIIEVEENIQGVKSIYDKLKYTNTFKIQDIFDPEAELYLSEIVVNGLTDKGLHPKFKHLTPEYSRESKLRFFMRSRFF
jgi:hypothetical protein